MQISALPFYKGDIRAHIASSASPPFIKFLCQTQRVSDHVLCVLEVSRLPLLLWFFRIDFGNVLMVLHSLFFILIAVYVKWFASSVDVGSSKNTMESTFTASSLSYSSYKEYEQIQIGSE